MDKAKQWIVLTAVGVLAVLAASWFLLVSPKRSEAAEVRELTLKQEATNTGLQGQLARLKQQAKDLPQQQAKLAAVAAKIPDNPALPALVRALTKAADETGVELVSMAPGTPADVAAAATAPTTPAAGTTSPSTSTGAPATSTAPKATTPLSSAPAPAANAGRLQSIALNLQVVGGFFQVEQFLDRLEALTRAFKTTNLKMAPGENPVKPRSAGSGSAVQDGRVLTATIIGSVYMASGRGLVAAPVVPAK